MKTIEDLIQEVQQHLLDSDSELLNFQQGSGLYTVTRALMAVVAEAYSDLLTGMEDAFLLSAQDSALDAHLGIFGDRHQGSVAQGKLIGRARSGAPDPITLEAGYLFYAPDDSIYYRVTTTTVVANTGYTLIPVRAPDIGRRYNMSAGIELTCSIDRYNNEFYFVSGTDGLDTAGLPIGPIRGGSDYEKDEDYRSRGLSNISSLSDGTMNAVRSAVYGVSLVDYAIILDQDPAPGWITIYIDDGTQGASDELLQDVKDVLEERKAASVGYRVLSVTTESTDVTIDVLIDPLKLAYGMSITVTAEEIKAKIRQYLASLVLGETLYLSKLTALCHEVKGVETATVTTPEESITPDEFTALRLGTLTLNVDVPS